MKNLISPSQNYIYIAGPFFNQDQKTIVENIENIVDELGYNYYSPMRHGRGILKDMTPTERNLIARLIFMDNCDEVNKANIIIAVTDDFDPGTMFEIGYAHSYSKLILTYSACGYDSNVMISQASDAHYKSLSLLKSELRTGKFIGQIRGTSE